MERLLVVEGEEDEKFFKALLRHSGINGVAVRSNPSGKGNSINTFKASLIKQTTASKARVGVVLDADYPQFAGGYGSTVAGINGVLSGLSWNPLTRRPGNQGHASTNAKYPGVQCGVWITPDNATDGYIEHMLLAEHVGAESARIQYAKGACAAALGSGHGFPTQAHHVTKAELGTWLAWQDAPRMSFAIALERSLFDTTKPTFVSLVGWLRWMYA